LEVIFETPGHVHVIRGDWNNAWIDEVIKFDGTGNSHDDQIDNLSAGYIFLVGNDILFDKGIRDGMAKRRENR
jgi:phage terminase large subunit-like protein